MTQHVQDRVHPSGHFNVGRAPVIALYCLAALLLAAAFPIAEAGEDRGSAPSPEKLSKALAEFNRGAAFAEQYRYDQAAKAFEEVLRLFPDWNEARFNLGLMYFQMNGRDEVDMARKAFDEVMAAEPTNLHARFCLGMCYRHTGDNAKALECFERVRKADPQDTYVAYACAELLSNSSRSDEASRLLEEVIARDPGFVSAYYRLFALRQREGKREQAMALMRRFRDLINVELDAKPFTVGIRYGTTGKYARLIGPENLPVARPASSGARILFSPEIKRLEVRLKPWTWRGGSVGLPGIAAGDLNGDGHLDLILTATGDNGQTTAWLNDGKGHFKSGPPIADKGVSPCLGDVDGDGRLDLWLGRAGQDLLFRGDGKGGFARAESPPSVGENLMTACARLADLDSDGQLDLLAFRWASGSLPAGGNLRAAASSFFAMDEKGGFSDIAPDRRPAFADAPVSCVVYDDFDNDYDLDLLVFPGKGKPIAWVNDRAWKFHLLGEEKTGLDVEGVVGATSGDPYKTGNRDLFVFTGNEVRLYRNKGAFQFELDKEFSAAFGRLGGTGGQLADIDNDGDLDLVIPDAHRRDGTRGPMFLVNDWPNRRFLDAADLDPGNLLAALHTHGDAACAVADFNGDGKCDILLAEMNEQPMLIENATRGGHYLAIDLIGERNEKSRVTLSNPSAIGARVEIRAGTMSQQYVVGLPSGPTALPPLRVHAGLGDNPQVQWLRIIWPDAVLQAELELAADRAMKITEVQRISNSCPHLFAWTGARFELVSDFAGVGGLGHWVAPDTYTMPDPTEYIPVSKLEARDGQYVLQVLESLEDCVYLDEAKLIAVDHPEGTEVYPNEMLAMGLPPPHFEVYCVGRPIEPVRAVDQRGSDVTDALRRIDRSYAGATDLDPRFLGFAKRHWADLDFGDQLDKLAPGTRLVLFLFGTTEFPYSTTNYAASRTGLRMEAPSFSVWRGGRWVELLHEAGCPAGLQHWMTVDLTGKLQPGDRKLRVESNMEIYWDRIFLASPLPAGPLRLREAPAQSADLHFLGYARPYSPDGRRPELYDYERVERAVPWRLMKGQYTRYGEVAELLASADDCFVIMGRGDEVTLRFPQGAFGPVPAGCRRTFLFKADAYTKDMSLYTAHGDAVEPLPFHAMKSYPYAPGECYPDNEKTREYRRQYNTRRVE